MKYGLAGLFMSVAFCSTCGGKLYYHTAKRKSKANGEQLIGSYSCSNYRRVPKTCTAHYITEKALKEIITEHLRMVISHANTDPEYFAQKLMDNSHHTLNKKLTEQKKLLKKHNQRITEIDTLFERLYEDNINNKITDTRFATLSQKFELEQSDLKSKSATLEAEITSQETQTKDIDKFIALAKEVIEVKNLTTSMVNIFINKIIIHDPCVPRGRERSQKIDIWYNLVGEVGEIYEVDEVELWETEKTEFGDDAKAGETVVDVVSEATEVDCQNVAKPPKPSNPPKPKMVAALCEPEVTKMDKPA